MAEELPQGQNIDVHVPPELENGVYANFAVVHHTQHEVTIDFCQLGTSPVNPGETAVVPVVSRIHIAPTFVMPLLQAISANLAKRDDALWQLGESEEGDDS